MLVTPVPTLTLKLSNMGLGTWKMRPLGNFRYCWHGFGYCSHSMVGVDHRDFSIHIERVLCVTFLWPIMYWPKMGLVKARKFEGEVKNIFVF